VSFLGQLQRRNVVRVALAYAVAAWLIIQIANNFFPALHLPGWTVTFVAALLVLGFPLVIVLAWAYEITPEGIKRTSEVPSGQSITKVTGRKLDRLIIVVLSVAVVFLVVDNYVLEGTKSAPPAKAAASAPVAANTEPARTGPAALPNSVAVLPFENLSPDQANAFFASGLHEEVLNQLAKLRSLSVISRTSVERYADTKLSIPEIARELNVETVMEGSVRYAGDRIRVTLQLINASTDEHLWSETYEREFKDVFGIESDIAMNVANALNAEFTPAEQRSVEAVPTSSPAAYALYLEARSQEDSSPDHGLELLDRALSLDPNFAHAIGYRAFLLAQSLTNTSIASAIPVAERAAVERQARELAGRALALDPDELNARLTLVGFDFRAWRWSQYFSSVDELVAAGRNVGTGVWFYAWAGRMDDALRVAHRVVELNPNDAGSYLSAGVVEAYAHRYRDADRDFRRALELAPALSLAQAWTAYIAIATGENEAALVRLRTTEQLLGENRPLVYLPELAYCYSRLGQPDEVARVVAEMRAREHEGGFGTGGWALAYLASGDRAAALEQLKLLAAKVRAHEPDEGFLNTLNLKMNFLNDPIRNDPEFAKVLDQIVGD
jgi:TolB-like protein